MNTPSGSERAVCVRCGGDRVRYDAICPACGHRPDGEGLLVAWLLSTEHVSVDALGLVQQRIRNGERIRPSGRMLDKARRALGAHFETDRGLSAGQSLLLLSAVLLLTPLVGWVLGAWWWNDRPRAAVQAFAFAVPSTVLFTVGVWWLRS